MVFVTFSFQEMHTIFICHLNLFLFVTVLGRVCASYSSEEVMTASQSLVLCCSRSYVILQLYRAGVSSCIFIWLLHQLVFNITLPDSKNLLQCRCSSRRPQYYLPSHSSWPSWALSCRYWHVVLPSSSSLRVSSLMPSQELSRSVNTVCELD